MTIVQVDKEHSTGGWAEEDRQERVYVCVPVASGESNRIPKAAFRFVNRRIEKDYSEVSNHTRVLKVENMSKDQFDMMFTHIN